MFDVKETSPAKDVNVEGVIFASDHPHNVFYARVDQHYAGVRVQYAKEEKRLSTGGAIQNAMQCITTSAFFAKLSISQWCSWRL